VEAIGDALVQDSGAFAYGDALSSESGTSSDRFNGGNFPQAQPRRITFSNAFVPPEDETICLRIRCRYLSSERERCGPNFQSVVLAEIVIPGGGTYKFGYNVYGEISKVTYPTTAFESYEYDPMISDLDEQQQPYVQAQRKSARESSASTEAEMISSSGDLVRVIRSRISDDVDRRARQHA
jgi:hypothetical protein